MKKKVRFLGLLAVVGSLTAASLPDARLPTDDEVTYLWEDAPQPGAAVEPHAAAKILRHSDVALMPEALPDDFSLYKGLHPRITAWGDDPIDYTAGNVPLSGANSHLRNDYLRFKSLGIEQAATNVWMLTATERYLYEHPEYQEAVCVDIANTKIVPPWLDGNYKGIRPWWGCTNSPRFRSLLEQRARAGLEAGASLLHLDDHNGTSACVEVAGGCFCAWCQAGFRSWLKSHFSPAELAGKGIPSIDEFRYADLVRQAGFTTRDSFIQGTWQGSVPLRAEFLSFQREAVTAFIAHLKRIARDILGRQVLVGVNSYNLQATGLQDAHVVDYWACEVQHFGVEKLVPPLVYKLADALGKPAFVTGGGEDWVRFYQAHCTTRVQRWIAEAYAFGHYFMYAWRKWGFTPATGTVWAVVGTKVYQPLTQFLQLYPRLFDGYEPLTTVGLIYSNTDVMNGAWEVRAAVGDRKGAWELRDVSRDLLDAGVSFRILAAGNEWLKQRLSPDQAQGLSYVIRPDAVTLDNEQKAVVDEWEKQGLAVSWSRARNQLDQVPGRITTNVPGKVWCLPRQAGPDRPLVIHLLNQDYQESGDAMVPQKRLEVRVDLRLWPGLQRTSGVSLYTPEAKPQALSFVIEQNEVIVNVPVLNLWGILAVH